MVYCTGILVRQMKGSHFCFTGGEMKQRGYIAQWKLQRELRGEKQLNQGLRKSVLRL